MEENGMHDTDDEGTGFNTEMILEFYRRGDKLISRHKTGKRTGKYILPNRTEDIAQIEEGMPYRCMVKLTESTADFAKIVSRVFIPRIVVRRDFVVVVIEEKQKIKHIALSSLCEGFKFMIDKGIYKWIIVVQSNDFIDEYDNTVEIDLRTVWRGIEQKGV